MKLRIEPLARTTRRVGPMPPGPWPAEGAGSRDLDLVLEPQLRANWCWAAVTCAIAAHYGDTSWQQEKLAWRILAADAASPAQGLPPPDLLELERYDQQAAMERTLRYVNCLAGWSSGRPPFRRLMREIDEGRPVAAAIRWHAGSQHYVLVDGYCRARRTISVADPQCGRATLDFDAFPLRYRHGGEWMETYWTHAPRPAHTPCKGELDHE